LEFDKHPVFLNDLPPMGEADVKFTRWSNVFQGDLVAYSVDGDFIPISLIHYEKQLLDDRRNAGQQPFRIALYRIRYKLPEEKKKVACVKNVVESPVAGTAVKGQLLLTGSKRRRGSGGPLLALTAPSSAASAASSSSASASAQPKSQGREYEYVDIATLYQTLQQAFRQRSGHRGGFSFMRVLAVLVGLGGTDFSRYFSTHFYVV
jgi:hypothetical protein